MSHQPDEELLARYAAGDCTTTEARAVEAHLAESPTARARLDQLRADEGWLDARHDAWRKAARHDDSSSAPTQALPNQPASSTALTPHIPPRIDEYDIQHELSRGGQGVVYQAIQTSTKRKVAIKVLLEGRYAAQAARRRFEREIELVAQLKHPGIISIFHSGTTPDGRPFYVMDFVRGESLIHHVRSHRLALDATLTLFAEVCAAVQFAHQRGVIHRDLKPSNIIVDPDGRPKVLDFGLAKWLAAPAETLVSITQEVVGTLRYMSPEQARGNPDEIDTRADVYALGVILYELLTGRSPYPIDGCELAEALRHISQTEAEPPSRRWSADVGITRRSGSRSTRCPIDNELETIVLKSLNKERTRRYQSAGELGRDIERYLAGEPIEAKRDSAVYVLAKQLRKHRVPAAVAALFVLTLTAGFVTSLIFWQQAADGREQARRDAARADTALNFVHGMFGSLRSADGAAEMTVREMLDIAADKVADGDLAPQPHSELDVHQIIAGAYRNLGWYQKSARHYSHVIELARELYGEPSSPLAEAYNDYASALFDARDLAGAEAFFRRALADRRRLSGPRGIETAQALCNLAATLNAQGRLEEAEPLFREALALRRELLDPDHKLISHARNNLATLLAKLAKYDEAEMLLTESLHAMAQQQNRLAVAWTRHLLGKVCHLRGDTSRAATLYQQALDGRAALLGLEHHANLLIIRDFIELLVEQRRFDEAIAFLRDDLAQVRSLPAVTPQRTNGTIELLVKACQAADRTGDADYWQQQLTE